VGGGVTVTGNRAFDPVPTIAGISTAKWWSDRGNTGFRHVTLDGDTPISRDFGTIDIVYEAIAS